MAGGRKAPGKTASKNASREAGRTRKGKTGGVLPIPRVGQKRRRKLRIRLRECIEDYERRARRTLTHRELADMANLSHDTVKKISNTKRYYNARLSTIEGLCAALGVSFEDILEWKD
jgi:DNA-binding Xre family transcriptional regulator